MRVAFMSILCLFFLFACHSPVDRLHEVESGMLELLGPAADVKIPVQEGNLQLPLPPPLEVQAEQKIRAQKLLADAAQIDSAALEPAQQQQLSQYRQVLSNLSGGGAGWPVDPLKYTLAEPLQRCLNEKGGESLAVLLEKMPEYYAEVEQRWGRPSRNITAAVNQCLTVLEQLEKLENASGKYSPGIESRIKTALPAAKAALKNYLGQCRSGVLEGN